MFLCTSLRMFFLLTKISDCGHVQLAICAVFRVGFESAVRIDKFLHPEENIKNNQPRRVSISSHWFIRPF